MKALRIWLHVIAALLGVAVAGVVVFLVFGSASGDGAAQDGAPGGSIARSGDSSCGDVAPADGRTIEAIQAGAASPPQVLDATDRPVTLTETSQQAWIDRLQGSGGLCVDSVKITGGRTSVTMSLPADVAPADASAWTFGVIQRAFEQPLRRPVVTVETFVGDQRRLAHVSQRAFTAFGSQRRGLGLAADMGGIAQFRRSVSLPKQDLRVLGWQPQG